VRQRDEYRDDGQPVRQDVHRLVVHVEEGSETTLPVARSPVVAQDEPVELQQGRQRNSLN
jgi:hypothetical protein